jgi:hypothetical protein
VKPVPSDLALITLKYIHKNLKEDIFSPILYFSMKERKEISEEWGKKLPRDFGGPERGMNTGNLIASVLYVKPAYHHIPYFDDEDFVFGDDYFRCSVKNRSLNSPWSDFIKWLIENYDSMKANDKLLLPSGTMLEKWLNFQGTYAEFMEKYKNKFRASDLGLIENSQSSRYFQTFEEFLHENLNESRLNVVRQEIPYETLVWDGSQNKKLSGKSKIVDLFGRKIVVFNVSGINIPFYLSTGEGKKKDVQPGKWYPFFGYSDGGWFNKLSGEQINRYYDIPLLKRLAEELDKQVGDVRKDSTIPRIKITGPQFDFINSGFLPVDNDEPGAKEKVISSIENLRKRLEKIGIK